jgi:hypothetical protein
MAIDNTELDVVIPEKWSEDFLSGTYQAAQVANRVQRVDAEVSASGDIVHLPFIPTFSVSDVTAATGAITAEDITLLEQQLTVDKWRHMAFQVPNKASKQALKGAIEGLKEQGPGALIADIESKLLNLYSDVTTNSLGSSADIVNEDLLTAAIGKLMDAKLGQFLRKSDDISFVFHTSQWAPAKKVNAWNDAHITGYGKGGAMDMEVPALYGVPVFFNAEVVSSGSARQNLLFIRHALALGVQKNIGFQEVPNTGLARTFACDVLYGVKTRKEDRAVLIKTKA